MVAVGFVVDNAIVVVEKITHHIENSTPLFDAIVNSTSYIAKTIVEITVILLAGHLAITFCTGCFIIILNYFGSYRLNNYFEIAGLIVPVIITLNKKSLSNP